jgi:hypothetical protein
VVRFHEAAGAFRLFVQSRVFQQGLANNNAATLDWYQKLIASKFDGSRSLQYPGRARIDDEIEQLVVRMAKENTAWGYDRIVGAML